MKVNQVWYSRTLLAAPGSAPVNKLENLKTGKQTRVAPSAPAEPDDVAVAKLKDAMAFDKAKKEGNT